MSCEKPNCDSTCTISEDAVIPGAFKEKRLSSSMTSLAFQ